MRAGPRWCLVELHRHFKKIAYTPKIKCEYLQSKDQGNQNTTFVTSLRTPGGSSSEFDQSVLNPPVRVLTLVSAGPLSGSIFTRTKINYPVDVNFNFAKYPGWEI